MDYKDINHKYKKYKLKKSNKKMKDICKPRSFKLQPQQQFLAEYFSNRKGPKGVLVYHKIGAGKTCTAINIAEKLKKKMQITVVLPAALIGNFRDELRSQCPGDEYLNNKERKQLDKLKPNDDKFKQIIKKSNDKINKYYRIFSYHKFVEICKNKFECNKKGITLKNNLLIIDEVQNMISESGPFYNNLKKIIDQTDNSLRIVLLSATPMFDKPVEIALTLNLLKPKNPIPIGTEFNNMFLKAKQLKDGIYYDSKNINKFKKMVTGLVSYYRGAEPVAFPEAIFKTVRCKMQHFQYASYLASESDTKHRIRGSFKSIDLLKLPNDFALGQRMISNISFPNKRIGTKGFNSLTNKSLQIQNVKDYSIKFYKIYKKINKSEGPCFIYSNFKGIGGLESVIKFFEAHGYKNYKTYGEGEKRFAVWTGDVKHHIKEEIKHVFNQKSNKNGTKLKIMLGSPSIKEGITLLRVDQVHILEPYWNIARMQQIIGRAIRFCSHKDMPKRRRRVEIFLYLATYPGKKTIDQYIWNLAKKKFKLIDNFERALKEMAIDCNLFYERNVYKNEEPLDCNI